MTNFLMPTHIESYAVLHALPICRMADTAFIPTYTVFILSYFCRDMDALYHHYKNIPIRDILLDPNIIATPDRDWAFPRTYPSIPLYRYALQGRLGWMDVTSAHLPLMIGRNLKLPEMYRKIPGRRKRYTDRKPT